MRFSDVLLYKVYCCNKRVSNQTVRCRTALETRGFSKLLYSAFDTLVALSAVELSIELWESVLLEGDTAGAYDDRSTAAVRITRCCGCSPVCSLTEEARTTHFFRPTYIAATVEGSFDRSKSTSVLTQHLLLHCMICTTVTR